jgi:hypothetical protein
MFNSSIPFSLVFLLIAVLSQFSFAFTFGKNSRHHIFSNVISLHYHPISSHSFHLFTKLPLSNFLDNEDADDRTVDPHRLPVIINPADYILSPRMDIPSVMTIFIGQTILLSFVLFLQIFTKFNIMPSAGHFDVNIQAFLMSISLSIPLIIGGYFFDQLPFDFPRQVNRSTKVFSLRLLGRTTPRLAAGIASFILSLCAGIISLCHVLYQ